MKKLFLFLFIAASMTSCNDGDLIVTNFNFEDKSLSKCGTETKVLFNLNNQDVHEAIALAFTPTNKDLFVEPVEGVVEIELNDQNQVIYRTFTDEVSADYFCNEIPSVSPEVVKEFRSTTGGTAVIATELKNKNDHDSDGIPSEEEGMDSEQDTDGDTIPDYLDIDDDGDNVRTADELNVEDETDPIDYSDTDEDGTPNYLDNDDDGDGIITRYEDWNKDTNPTNDLNEEGLPYYLNPTATTSFTVTKSIKNTFSQSFRYTISIKNLTLKNQGGNGEQIRIENYNLGYLDSAAVQITLPDTEEDGDNGDQNNGGEDNGEEKPQS